MPERIASTFASRFRRQHLDVEDPAVERPGLARRLWSVLLVAVAFALFGAVVWLAYQDAGLGPPTGEPPLIRAAPDPVKVRPEEAEDTTLAAEQGTVGRLWSDVEPADPPERLLPTPETPLSPPVVEEPATAEATVEPPASEPAEAEAPEVAATTGAPRATEGGADQAAGDAGPSVAALPEQPADVPQSTPPAPDPSVREAEAALDRLLAEVTAPSGDADGPAGSDAAPTDQASPARSLDQEQSAARRPSNRPTPRR